MKKFISALAILFLILASNSLLADPTWSFRPGGPTILITGATVAPTGVQATGPTTGTVQYVIYNADPSNDAWLGYGPTAAQAQTNAVIPTSAGKLSVSLPHGSMQTLTLSGSLYFSAISAAGTPAIYITPGEGQ